MLAEPTQTPTHQSTQVPTSAHPRWTTRLHVTSNVVHIGGFVVAVSGAMVIDGLTSATALAILAASVGVVLSTLVRIPIDARDVRPVGILVACVALFSIAVGVTGGLSSPFVVMPLATLFLAGVGGGARVAAPVAVLCIGGAIAAAWLADAAVDIEAVIRVPAIYAITAIAFSEVHRALRSETARADDIQLASESSRRRRARLEETHELLGDLLSVATSPDVNAVAAAQDALREVGVLAPDAPSRIVGSGNVTLAVRGEQPATDPSHTFAIARSDDELARLDLWLEAASLTPSQRSAIEHTITPVALAIENDAMVQQLAGLTIQRERVRLARELHDDIAPSIASVGLALDMVLLGDGLSPDDERTLEATRSTVTRLVDRIRDRVQDLRADRSVSIVQLANSLVAEVDTDGPTVFVDIDERTPPRPAIAAEIGALITEAFRNAIVHAGATSISIMGKVDEDAGSIEIADNGRGFDPADRSFDRFGLVGMGERANLIGADLAIESVVGTGTRVTVQWKEAS